MVSAYRDKKRRYGVPWRARDPLSSKERPVLSDGSAPPGQSASNRSLLSVSHLTKSYGSRPAVRDVSFETTTGITGLLGPNGAGKTTLFRCIAGLAGWDAGEVRIEGIDLARRPGDARRRIGFMPERVAFPTEMRVEEYLRFVSEVKGIPRSQRPAAIEAALAQAGLDGSRARIVGNLSKGYRQRVGLAQALLADASVVLLDEPSAGLDPLNVMEMRDVLRACAQDRTVIVSTHLLPEARLLCDRVIVMSHGSVVYDGPTAGMVGAGGAVRVRIRVQRAGANSQAPAVGVAGATLVHCQGADGDYVMVVDADSDASVGALVEHLVGAGWSVVGVEPTMDVLEEAFRAAVIGVTPLAVPERGVGDRDGGR